METAIAIKSHRYGTTWIRVDEKDLERVQPIAWHVVRNTVGRVLYVAATLGGGRRQYLGRNDYGKNVYSRSAVKSHQIKLHEFIMGDIPKCKAIRHRDGDPLNNTRKNLALYQAYHTEKLDCVKKSEVKLNVCIGCINENICRRVATRKKIFKDKSHEI